MCGYLLSPPYQANHWSSSWPSSQGQRSHKVSRWQLWQPKSWSELITQSKMMSQCGNKGSSTRWTGDNPSPWSDGRTSQVFTDCSGVNRCHLLVTCGVCARPEVRCPFIRSGYNTYMYYSTHPVCHVMLLDHIHSDDTVSGSVHYSITLVPQSAHHNAHM